jgi:hypothetical protein
MRRGDTTRRIGMENFTQRQEVGPMPTDVLVTPADLAPLLRLLLEAEGEHGGGRVEGPRGPESPARATRDPRASRLGLGVPRDSVSERLAREVGRPIRDRPSRGCVLWPLRDGR